MAAKKLEDHEISQIFPMADVEDFDGLVEHIKKNGQQEPIILLDGKILDGRNRYEACLKAGIAPMTADFEKLNAGIREAGAVEFVMGRNLNRRHLTASQRAAIAAEALPFFEAEAAERKKAGLKQNQPIAQNGANGGDEFNQEPPVKPEDESQARPKKTKGKSSEQAAKKFKVGARSVEKAKELKKKDPKAFEKVKTGGTTLNKATKNVSAEERKKSELDAAVKRIADVCGKASAEKAKSRKRAEIIGWAAMKDEDMKKIAGLMDNGWKLEVAKKFRITSLTWKSTLKDLRNRCDANGGKFSEDLGDGYTVEIKKAKA